MKPGTIGSAIVKGKRVAAEVIRAGEDRVYLRTWPTHSERHCGFQPGVAVVDSAAFKPLDYAYQPKWLREAMPVLLLCALALTACGPPPLCEHKGVRFYGIEGKMPDAWSCEAFSEYLDVIVETFDRTQPQPYFARATFEAEIKGYEIWVNPATSWYSAQHHKEISGLCQCDTKQTLIQNAPPRRSDVMAHELAHAAQHCTPTDHSNWDKPGPNGASIDDAIWQTYNTMHGAGAM